MLPQSWTNSIQPVAPEELCPHLWRQSEILLQFMGYLLDALRKFSSLILYLLQGQVHLLEHTCKGVGYSLFPLISNANQRKRIMTAFELLHTLGQFSFPILLFSVFLYLRGLYLPYLPLHWNRLFLCGKCWGGEIDTKCKRNNQRSSTACGSSGFRVLAELTQLTIHTGKEYLQSLKNFIWKQRGNKG